MIIVSETALSLLRFKLNGLIHLKRVNFFSSGDVNQCTIIKFLLFIEVRNSSRMATKPLSKKNTRMVPYTSPKINFT